jgi:hypothetical protein
LPINATPIQWSDKGKKTVHYGAMAFNGFILKIYVCITMVLLALFWSWLLNCSYGLCMLLLIAVYYLLREHKLAKILIGCGISVVYITAPSADWRCGSITESGAGTKTSISSTCSIPSTCWCCGICPPCWAKRTPQYNEKS